MKGLVLDVKTTKPISTISFNSPSYLALKLDELIKSRVVTFYAFVPHVPEDDEGGSKEHIHVYIEPSKLLQTDDLRDFLKEFDPMLPDKPKGCLPFHSSKFDDWYMYGLHDKRYLASKGESRRYHYLHDDFVSSDTDYLNFLVKRIDLTSLMPYSDIQASIDRGESFMDYFGRALVPITQLGMYEKAYHLLQANSTYRGSHSPHPCDVDVSTGEILDMKGDLE